MANPETQTYNIKIVRAAAALTTGYVAGIVLINCEEYNQLMLFLKFTKSSLSKLEIKIEFTFDGGTIYYPETFSAISEGESTETTGIHKRGVDGNFVIALPIKCSSIKVSAKGTGTVTSSSLKIDAVLGVS